MVSSENGDSVDTVKNLRISFWAQDSEEVSSLERTEASTGAPSPAQSEPRPEAQNEPHLSAPLKHTPIEIETARKLQMWAECEELKNKILELWWVQKEDEGRSAALTSANF